jgi:peptidoglycan/xylan/chitin deacetylase (PgdA/CDA1 family)
LGGSVLGALTFEMQLHHDPLKELVRPLASRVLGSIYSARTTDPVAAFTFDDGPDEHETPRILDALEDHRARATFFVLGERARRYPELVRTIRSRGHEVGLHADVHRPLTQLTLRAAAARIRRSKRDLEAILGEPITFFRPPFGFLSRRTYLIARSLSLRVVVWSAQAEDWHERPVEQLVATALRGLRPGAILLLHERYEPPATAIPPTAPTFDRALLVRTLLAETTARGWSVVTVGELLSGRRVERRLWFRRPEQPPGLANGGYIVPRH